MLRRTLLKGLAAAAALCVAGAANAQDVIKIGLVLPLTGPFASTGKQLEAGARLYLAQHGDMVAGKKIQLVVRDDTGVPDVSKRVSQELVVNEKVAILAGFGLTPNALAVAPIATESKVPQVVMAAATSIITEKSPFIVRSSFTAAQTTVPIGEWAAKNGIKKVVTLVSDYAPGIDIEKTFVASYSKAGGKVLESLRVPLRDPDFAPFLQRAADAKPDALFIFVPAGIGATLMKQYVERGLDKAGIKLLAEGSVTDDDILDRIGPAALGLVTSHHYSVAHPSKENKDFVAAFKKANANRRPNFMGVGAYDGMHLIMEALKKTKGATDGTALVAAMKGMKWTSPRGPVMIDPDTRDIVQNVYLRKVEKVGDELYNVEFMTVPDVKDPVKAAMKK